MRMWDVCRYVSRLRCAKTAKRIEVSFGIETLGDPRQIVLDGGLPFFLPSPYIEPHITAKRKELGRILPLNYRNFRTHSPDTRTCNLASRDLLTNSDQRPKTRSPCTSLPMVGLFITMRYNTVNRVFEQTSFFVVKTVKWLQWKRSVRRNRCCQSDELQKRLTVIENDQVFRYDRC